jgi:hypothetical protein
MIDAPGEETDTLCGDNLIRQNASLWKARPGAIVRARIRS